MVLSVVPASGRPRQEDHGKFEAAWAVPEDTLFYSGGGNRRTHLCGNRRKGLLAGTNVVRRISEPGDGTEDCAGKEQHPGHSFS